MYLTNSQCVQTFLQYYDIQTLQQYLRIIIQAYKQHGRIFWNHTYQWWDQQIEEMFALCTLLKHYRKNNLTDLTKLLHIIYNQTNIDQAHYEITSNNTHLTHIIWDYLKYHQEQADIEHHINDNIGIFIKGKGMIYKRSLQGDLKKILS